MTDLETLREELAAKTRALADSEAECGRLRSQVIPDQALSEMLADAQRHGGASASALWRGRVDGLTEERDTLRAQLAEAQKEIKGLRLVAFDLFERAERMGDRAECIAQLATEIQAKAEDSKRIAGPIIDKVFDAAEKAEQTQTPKGDAMRTAKELAEQTRFYERNTLGSAKTYFTEVAAALDRLAACEPVIEALLQEGDGILLCGLCCESVTGLEGHAEHCPFEKARQTLPAKVTT